MAAETIMVNTLPCIVQQSAFNCAVNLEKLGKATIIGFLNSCTSPMELDLTVEILQTVWLLSFVLSNKNERRLIGFDFWPVSVHFRNGSSDLSNDDHHRNSTESIKVCFEFLKSGKYSCFLDIIETADISSMQCPVIATVSSRTASKSGVKKTARKIQAISACVYTTSRSYAVHGGETTLSKQRTPFPNNAVHL
ncbi:Phosphate acyltransferase [Trichinella spiralis]|uniref:Phosphate acyltransferase n=1 Tax=Trichinella spiralis TaxID=6334 RepID=A0ABR3K668_TRISP